MSKRMSTTQMIEKLEIGQRAEMVAPVTDVVVQRTTYGIIVVRDASSMKHIGQPLFLSTIVMQGEWVFERVEISFDEAIERLKEGEPVHCECDEVVNGYTSLSDYMMINEVVNGKWFAGVYEN